MKHHSGRTRRGRDQRGRTSGRGGTPSILLLGAYNFAVSLIIATGYLPHIEAAGRDWLLIAFEAVSHYGGYCLLLSLLAHLLYRLIPYRPVFTFATVVLLTIVQMLLYLDTVIYHLFRFHLNGLVVNVIASEALGESVHLGFQTISMFVGIAVLIAAGQFLVLYTTRRVLGSRSWLRSRTPRLIVVSLLISVFAVEKGVYAWGDLVNLPHLFKFTRVFPLYVPLTIKKFAQRHLGFRMEQESGLTFSYEEGLLNYPVLKALPGTASPAPRPNIIILVIDSWRFDMLNRDMTPNLWEFKKRCIYFKNHYTAGNGTRWGVFSLLYGLHATYWDAFLTERRGTVLIDALKMMNYQFEIISSTKLTFPEFRRTAFVSIPEAINDDLGGDVPAERDRKHEPVLLNWLEKYRDPSRPFFALLFMDAPHSPYSYPDEFEKYTPAAKNINYLKVVNGTDITHVNRYKNGVYFDDYLAGKMIRALEKRGLLRNTVLIITSDHGEEFWESGYWSHTSAFTIWQNRVPLLVYAPGVPPREVDTVTSHLDVVPTIFDLTGCPELTPRYTLGRTLLHPSPREYWGVTGFRNCALFLDKRIIVFNTHFKRASEVQVFDYDYKPVEDKRAELKKHAKLLARFMEEHRRFLK